MKSVGEAMSIGRTIHESMQKALASMESDLTGFDEIEIPDLPVMHKPGSNLNYDAATKAYAEHLQAMKPALIKAISKQTPDRLRTIAQAMRHGMSIDDIKEFYKTNDDIDENYVRIINTKNYDRLLGLIDADKIYFGGNTDRENRFISPTILQNVSFDDDIMKDEIFGPILPIISYTEIDEAILKSKRTTKAFSLLCLFKKQKDNYKNIK